MLKLRTEGCSNKEIGSRLSITEGTVKNHMTNVLGKGGLSSLIMDAVDAGLQRMNGTKK